MMRFPQGLKIPAQHCLSLLFCLILALGLSACEDSRAQNLLHKANDEWVKGRNHSAVEIFKSVLEVTPSGPVAEEALFRLGEIYHFGLGETDQAISYFQEVVGMTPRGTYAYNAQKYIAEIVENTFKDLDQAIIEYQNLINDYNNLNENVEHQFRIASIYLKKHNYEQAFVEYELLLENYPRSPWTEEAQFRSAEILYTLKRCPEARESYSKFKVDYPGSKFTPEIEFIMASCLEDEGKLKLALTRFQNLKDSYPYPALIKMKLEGIENRIKKGGRSKKKIPRYRRRKKDR